MYLNITVRIPDIRGKIITKKKGATTYILYQYGSKYNQEKQYAVPLRAIVGKVSPEDPTLMYPNEKYQVYFPDARIPEELPFAYRSCCLKIGPCIVIQKVLDEYRLLPMLRTQFGNDTGLILLNSTTKDQCLRFLDDWNKNRDHKNRIYFSYDSTNKNSAAGDIDIVEFGKAKDDKGLPVFNLSIAMDKTNRVPLFYEEYPGSVTDVSQFTLMVDKAIEYGYKKIGFILDRGYFSKKISAI